MGIFSTIQQPALLIDETRCRNNIARMAEKAAHSGVRFRPHFKTHQSAVIGGWFRPYGVTAITVSSLSMARYFAAHGWCDITIAFPVNLRQMAEINALASSIHLGVLAESAETIDFLAAHLSAAVDLWLKADVGARRTGIVVDDHDTFMTLARRSSASPRLLFRGVLTHAGQTYHAANPDAVKEIYRFSVKKLLSLRADLRHAGFPQAEISWGDTPSCSLLPDLSAVDEIRPGNFVFYDITQLQLGTCREEDLAVGIACPVVALHPERSQAVIYGGAIHLSKECLQLDGNPCYGLVAVPAENGWGGILPCTSVVSVSQEHGLVAMPPQTLQNINIGSLLIVLPVHSCLAVNLFPEYLTLGGWCIPIFR